MAWMLSLNMVYSNKLFANTWFITDSTEKFKKIFQPLVYPVCSLKMFTFEDCLCEVTDNKDKDPYTQFSKRSCYKLCQSRKIPLSFPVVKYRCYFFSHLAPKLLNIERTGLTDSFGIMWPQSNSKWTTSVEVSLFCLTFCLSKIRLNGKLPTAAAGVLSVYSFHLWSSTSDSR